MWRNIGDHPWSLLILLLIVVIVFGANKLPVAAKSLGQSLKIFKREMADLKDPAPGTTNPISEAAPGRPSTGTTDVPEDGGRPNAT